MLRMSIYYQIKSAIEYKIKSTIESHNIESYIGLIIHFSRIQTINISIFILVMINYIQFIVDLILLVSTRFNHVSVLIYQIYNDMYYYTTRRIMKKMLLIKNQQALDIASIDLQALSSMLMYHHLQQEQ